MSTPYNVIRAIRMALNYARLDGLEHETSQELAKNMGRSPRGLLVPHSAFLTEQRNLLSGTTGVGATPTAIPANVMYDALRPKSVVARLGANIGDFSGGQKGNVALPTKSATTTISWVGEDTANASQTNMTVGQHQLKPQTATAYTDVSRRMLKEGAPGFEAFIFDDLRKSVGVAIDTAVLNGTGPIPGHQGLFQSGVWAWPVVNFAGDTGNGAAPDYKSLTLMKAAVGRRNADTGDARLGWVTSSAGRSALENCDMGGSTVTGRMAWKAHRCVGPNGQMETVESMLGWPAEATELAPSNGTRGSGSNLSVLLCGNWSHVFVQLWGAVEIGADEESGGILVDPYRQSTLGLIRVRIYQDLDFDCLHPGNSFSSAAGMITPTMI